MGWLITRWLNAARLWLLSQLIGDFPDWLDMDGGD